jgi:succinoglycan biosynthesis protein ExoM
MKARSMPVPLKPQICVCICTYKRPRLLGELLGALDRQETAGLFEHTIVVVDNDKSESGRTVVEDESNRLKIPILYLVEPEQNIALARNKAVANAHGDYVAFIDDDELPDSRWLLNMYKALILFETAGVLGPVLPRYDVLPPRWVLNGRFFERPRYFSGYFLDWELTRTGNCLLRRAIFEEKEDWFLPKFGSGGEDRDFFKRMIARGHVFVWCDEAPVYESVLQERMKKRVKLKRALLRGKLTYRSQMNRPEKMLGSMTAVIYYSLGLPLLLLMSPLFGFDIFMKNLIRDCDHLGKILAMCKIDLVRERYIT